MASTRATRSLRSTGPAPAIGETSQTGPNLLQPKSRKVPTPHNRSRVQKHKKTATTSRNEGADDDGALTAEESADSDEADDEQDEQEQKDVHAPPNESQKVEVGTRNGTASKRSTIKDREHRAGELDLNEQLNTNGETPSQKVPQAVSSVSMMRMPSRRSEESDNDSDEGFNADEDIAEDDDEGYDALEKMSDVSDNSADFEAAVEKEVMAEDALGMIDWDRQSIFDYDEKTENPYTDPAELHLFPPIRDDFLRELQRQYDDIDMTAEEAENTIFTAASFMALEQWPTSESGTERSNRSNSHSPVHDEKTQLINSRTSFEIDHGETTEEDEMPIKTVNPSSAALSRQHSSSSEGKSGRKSSTSRGRQSKNKARELSGTRTPVMRKVKVNPNRAIAYSEHTPYGRIVHFKLPKNGAIVVVDLGSRSPTTSGASSPTMINLNDALVDGNTNSGAHITDVINAHLFRSYHCTRRSSDPFEALSPSDYDEIPRGGAWRPLTRSESDQNLFLNIEEHLHEDDTHRFLDLDALESDDDTVTNHDRITNGTVKVQKPSRKRQASEQLTSERPLRAHTKKARMATAT